MNVFVTGGSGFLGQRLLRRLTQDGHRVTALARSDAAANAISPYGAEVVRGSVESVQGWAGALRGQDIVVHCAAPVEFWGPWDRFHQGITVATRNMLTCSGNAGVKRFVHVSTEAVLFDDRPLLGIDETHPYPRSPNSHYGKAKLLAEREVLDFRSDMTCIILRPPYIWGKGTPALDRIEEYVKTGRFTWVDGGRHLVETVHVENVVEAVVCAFTHGQDKGIYFVTDDDPVTVRELLTALLRTRGIEPPEKNIPGAIGKPLACVVDSMWRALGLRGYPPLSRFDFQFIGIPRQYTIARARRELGYRPVLTRDSGLQEMMN
jgi:nucleoside-diphosphate-sugar epimerase